MNLHPAPSGEVNGGMIMARLQENETAPDFTSQDFSGKEIQLRSLLEKGPVYLVLNRGFT